MRVGVKLLKCLFIIYLLLRLILLFNGYSLTSLSLIVDYTIFIFITLKANVTYNESKTKGRE